MQVIRFSTKLSILKAESERPRLCVILIFVLTEAAGVRDGVRSVRGVLCGQRQLAQRHHGGRARRAQPGQVGPARALPREGRGQGAPREVPHRQVRHAPDEPHPQAPRRRDVALRRAAEALRASGELEDTRGGGGHR